MLNKPNGSILGRLSATRPPGLSGPPHARNNHSSHSNHSHIINGHNSHSSHGAELLVTGSVPHWALTFEARYIAGGLVTTHKGAPQNILL